jgi:hypothetical protein
MPASAVESGSGVGHALVAEGIQEHPDLAVLPLAQRRTVLALEAHRPGALPSRTYLCGMRVGTRIRADSVSYGLTSTWFGAPEWKPGKKPLRTGPKFATSSAGPEMPQGCGVMKIDP